MRRDFLPSQYHERRGNGYQLPKPRDAFVSGSLAIIVDVDVALIARVHRAFRSTGAG
jgi:hypothetical protein